MNEYKQPVNNSENIDIQPLGVQVPSRKSPQKASAGHNGLETIGVQVPSRKTPQKASVGRNGQESPDGRKWYALKVHFNRIAPVLEYLEGKLERDLEGERGKDLEGESGVRCFVPMHTVEKYTGGKLEYSREQLVKSLLFVQCTPETLSRTRAKFSGQLTPYYDSVEGKYLVIPDRQMDAFIALCDFKDSGLEYLGQDEGKYHLGDRVRVTEGVFKGLEGHIKRIRHDRRLVVTIDGIAAFATGFIPPAFLEVIGQDERK
jgi:transcription antitermination factor NusG